MKTIALATSFLLSLAGCQKAPEAAAIDNNAAMIEDSLERQADNMEAMANNAADQDAAQAMQNAADHLQDIKGNVAEAADAAKDKLQR